MPDNKDTPQPRADEVPYLIALPGGVCMVGPMGRRMFRSGRKIWGTRDGPLVVTATSAQAKPAPASAKVQTLQGVPFGSAVR